jgi:hypothetical protein
LNKLNVGLSVLFILAQHISAPRRYLLLDLSPRADAGFEALLAYVVLSLIFSHGDGAVEVC